MNRATYVLAALLLLPATLPAQTPDTIKAAAAEQRRADEALARSMQQAVIDKSYWDAERKKEKQHEFELQATPVPCWNGTKVAWYVCPLQPIDYYKGSWRQLHEGTIKAWLARTGLPSSNFALIMTLGKEMEELKRNLLKVIQDQKGNIYAKDRFLLDDTFDRTFYYATGLWEMSQEAYFYGVDYEGAQLASRAADELIWLAYGNDPNRYARGFLYWWATWYSYPNQVLPEKVRLEMKANEAWLREGSTSGVAFLGRGNIIKEMVKAEREAAAKAAEISRDKQAAEALNKGSALLESGNPAAAVEQFREAARLKPDDAGTRDTLARTMMDAGQYESAITEYQWFVTRYPEVLANHANLALAMACAGHMNDALAQLDLAGKARFGLTAVHSEKEKLLARMSTRKGDFAAAIPHYVRAIELFYAPREEPYVELAMALARAGQKPLALWTMDKAAALFRDSPTIRPARAKLLAEIGTDTVASLKVASGPPASVAAGTVVVNWEIAAQLSEKGGQAWLRLEFAAAALLLKEAVRFAPQEPKHRLNLGDLLWENKQQPAAILQFQKAVELEPENSDYHIWLANKLANAGRKDEALAEADKAVALSPDDKALREEYKGVQEVISNLSPTPAKAPAKRPANSSPANAAAASNAASSPTANAELAASIKAAQEQIKAIEKAAAVREKKSMGPASKGLEFPSKSDASRAAAPASNTASSANPNAALAQENYLKGMEAWRRNDFVAGVAPLQEAVRLAPEIHEYRMTLGWALKGSCAFSAALTQFQKALELRPDDAWDRIYAAQALAGMGKREAALQEAEKATSSHPDWVQLRYARDELLARTGPPAECAAKAEVKPAPAAPASNTASSANPNAALAEENFKKGEAAWLRSGHYAEGVAPYQEAVRLAPENYEYRFALGDALMHTCAFAAALTQFQKALELRPEQAWYRMYVAQALAGMGKREAALQEADKAISGRSDWVALRVAHDELLASPGPPAECAAKAEAKPAPAAPASNTASSANPNAALAEENFKKGEAAWRRFDYVAGVAPLQEAVRLAPENPDYREKLGFVLMDTCAFPAALTQFQKALELRPDYAWDRMFVAQALAETGKREAALQEAEKATSSHPDWVQLRDARDKLLARTGPPAECAAKAEAKPAPAAPASNAASSANPNAALAEENFKKGDAAWRRFDYVAGVAPLQEAVRLAPENHEYRITLGWVLMGTCAFSAALTQFQKALELQPDDAWDRMSMAQALAGMGKREAALQEADKAISGRSDRVELRDARDELLARTGPPAECAAKAEAKPAPAAPANPPPVKSDAYDPVAQGYVNKGIDLMLVGKAAESAAAFQEALRLKPGDWNSRTILADMLTQSGQFAAAIPEFEKLIAHDPRDVWQVVHLVGYANALAGVGRTKDAYAQFDKATALKKWSPQVLEGERERLLAHVAVREKDYATAIAHFQKAIALSPGVRVTEVELAEALAASGQKEEALRMIDKLIAKYPTDKPLSELREKLASGPPSKPGAAEQPNRKP